MRHSHSHSLVHAHLPDLCHTLRQRWHARQERVLDVLCVARLLEKPDTSSSCEQQQHTRQQQTQVLVLAARASERGCGAHQLAEHGTANRAATSTPFSPLGEQLLGCRPFGWILVEGGGHHLPHASTEVAAAALRLQLRRRALRAWGMFAWCDRVGGWVRQTESQIYPIVRVC